MRAFSTYLHLEISIRVIVVCLLTIFFASFIKENDMSSTKPEKLMFLGHWVLEQRHPLLRHSGHVYFSMKILTRKNLHHLVCCLDGLYLVLLHSSDVYHSIETLTLGNLHCLLCCLDVGAWCCCTTVTTRTSQCVGLVEAPHCSETPEPVVATPQGRLRTCQRTGPVRYSLLIRKHMSFRTTARQRCSA